MKIKTKIKINGSVCFLVLQYHQDGVSIAYLDCLGYGRKLIKEKTLREAIEEAEYYFKKNYNVSVISNKKVGTKKAGKVINKIMQGKQKNYGNKNSQKSNKKQL